MPGVQGPGVRYVRAHRYLIHNTSRAATDGGGESGTHTGDTEWASPFYQKYPKCGLGMGANKYGMGGVRFNPASRASS